MSRASQLQKFRTDGKTVSPERLVVMLYQRCARDLASASAAIVAGDAEGRHTALMHAQEIVEELSYAVRPDLWEGGEGLLALYNYVLELLVKGNVESDRRAIAQAAKVIDQLASAWQEAYEEVASTPQPPAGPSIGTLA